MQSICNNQFATLIRLKLGSNNDFKEWTINFGKSSKRKSPSIFHTQGASFTRFFELTLVCPNSRKSCCVG